MAQVQQITDGGVRVVEVSYGAFRSQEFPNQMW